MSELEMEMNAVERIEEYKNLQIETTEECKYLFFLDSPPSLLKIE